ncbi:unnamed protein product [marine sediment metagenome]|uniref:Uncharacterized protein n=1 Tax=marine sediment metagenome TaxID=412755 RepID=X1VBY5_9ZZZZ
MSTKDKIKDTVKEWLKTQEVKAERVKQAIDKVNQSQQEKKV